MTEFTVVIPARYASSRLPGKPLADLGGRPMIQWVHERAVRSGAAEVIVATDDERIAAACRGFGARVEMTAADHATGTDRIAELAQRLGWGDQAIVVNVQGDEPLVPPHLAAQAAGLLEATPDAAVATLAVPLGSSEEFADPHTAKVVVDRRGFALYFSRAPIPGALTPVPLIARRHIGLYAYRVGDLKAICGAAPCALEEVERLEQLRVLWLGYRIIVADAEQVPPRAVDTEADLEWVRTHIAATFGKQR